MHERFCEELGATGCSMLFPFYSKQAPDHSCSIVYAAGARIVVRLLSEAPAICSACSLPASLGVLRGVQFQEENKR